MRRLALFALLLTLLLSAAPLRATEEGLVVTVDEPLGAISPYVRGANCGILCAIPVAMFTEAQNSGVTLLRYGGGFSDERELTSSNIDTFMATAQLVGADPMITVRLHNSTPEASAEDVRYANIERGYNVRYWSIGNEPTLFANLFRTEYDAEQHSREWRAHAEAMLAVDPSIILVGPDLHQYPGVPGQNPRDSAGRDWLETFLEANGDLIGIVSIHRYPFPRSQANPVVSRDDLRLNSREWDENIIPMVRDVTRRITGRDIPVGVMEINSSWANNQRGEATMDSLYNAIWYGDVLGRLIRQRVEMVAYWDFQRRDLSFGLIGGSQVRPTYYTVQMYARFGSEAVMTASDVPDVNIYAALRDDGALTMMIVNLSAESATMPLTITGFDPAEEAELWRLDAEHRGESLGLHRLESSLTVPGDSLTLLIVAPQS
jgi:hypothetical protein